ncbi:MAG: hypothetical protein J0L53_17405 [Spirochaetes bacterium]|nr:hypothetical protein [Spirochaetota bacterium]
MPGKMQTTDACHIPAPLRDWLDHAILTQMNASANTVDNALARKVSIAHAILYPFEHKPEKRKPRKT